MNRLQRLPRARRVHGQLGMPAYRPGAGGRPHDYAHPVYTSESWRAVPLAGAKHRVTAFAGAYHGWGFHEDGAGQGSPPRGVFRGTGDRSRRGPRCMSAASSTPARATAQRFSYRTFLWLVDLMSCPTRAAGCGCSPGSTLATTWRPRSYHPGQRRYSCKRRHRPRRRPGAYAGARTGLGHVFNPLTIYWCHPRTGNSLACRRGAQHLRAAPRLPGAHRRPGPRRTREGALRLAVPPRRRRVPDEPAAPG